MLYWVLCTPVQQPESSLLAFMIEIAGVLSCHDFLKTLTIGKQSLYDEDTLNF